MRYGIIENGILKYAPINLKKDNKVILNFNKNIDLMVKYGYKQVIDIKPTYNKLTQRVISIGYEENIDNITILYSIVDVGAKVTLEDRVVALENNQSKMLNILSEEINK